MPALVRRALQTGAIVAAVALLDSCYVARSVPVGGAQPASRIRLESPSGLALFERRADGSVASVGCTVNIVDGTLREVQSRSFVIERVKVRRPKRPGPGCAASPTASFVVADVSDLRMSAVAISGPRTVAVVAICSVECQN